MKLSIFHELEILHDLCYDDRKSFVLFYFLYGTFKQFFYEFCVSVIGFIHIYSI